MRKLGEVSPDEIGVVYGHVPVTIAIGMDMLKRFTDDKLADDYDLAEMGEIISRALDIKMTRSEIPGKFLVKFPDDYYVE